MKNLLFGVVGSPILHSKSPLLFEEMFNQTQTAGDYVKFGLSSAQEIKYVIDILNLKGINVTSPFKEKVIPYLDKIDDGARQVNAVNTIVKNKNSLIGYNTDIYGVIDSFKTQNINLEGKKVIILGAGGASRTAAFAAVHSKAADVVIISRTFSKGEIAANRINCRAANIDSLKTELKATDIIISCIPSSITPVKKEWLLPKHIVFDANYKNSPLNQFAEQAGCKIINGLDWLKYQAIPAFEHLTGKQIAEKDKKDIFKEVDLYKNKNSIRKNIFLIGFMGTGKSSIGKLLADHLNINFLDTDNLIEQKEGKSIPEIFKINGEEYFRKVEQSVLFELSEIKNTVIATGGGIIESLNNREFIKKSGTVIWLVVSMRTLFERTDSSSRPLWQESKLQKLWDKRIPFYANTSDLVILNENKKIDEVVKRILQEDILIPDS